MAETADPDAFIKGVRVAWLDEGQVFSIATDGSGQRSVVEAWREAMLAALDCLPSAGPLMMLHDISRERGTFTDFSLAQAEAVLDRLPTDRPIYGAYVVAPQQLHAAITRFIRGRSHHLPDLTERFFLSADHALAWLRRMRSSNA